MISTSLDLSASTPLEDAIWLSLNTRRGSFWQRPQLGSDLYTLEREVLTPDLPKRVEGMVRSALAWLVGLDRLRDLVVVVTVPRPHMLAIQIGATGINGQPIDLSMFVPVGVVP